MKILDGLRKPDWLAELNAVLIFSIVVVAIGGVVGAAELIVGNAAYVEVPAQYAVDSRAATPGLFAGAAVDTDSWLTVKVADPSASVKVLAALNALPDFLLALMMLVVLQRAVAAVRRGDPFRADISRRLGWLGFILIVGGSVASVVSGITGLMLVDQVTDQGPAFSFEFNVVWFLAGLGFLAVAELVKRGVALRAELDEVI
jgi:hypothetical protein